MGFFSGSVQTYVSSSVYNMAGDIQDRPNFLKSLVIGGIIGESQSSIGDTLKSGYANGPGSRMRSFYRWAINNYAEIGLPGGSIFTASSVDTNVIKAQMINAFGLPAELAINWVETENADITYWARQRIGLDHPELAGIEWQVDYDAPSDTAVITFKDGQTAPIIFAPENFDARKGYIYVSYSLPKPEGGYEEPLMFIYQVASGNNLLDTQYLIQSLEGRYIPFIPIRIDNKFLSDSFRPNHYALAKKAYKKATGGEFEDLVKQLKDNENLNDIDYCFVVFGVSLNTPENAGREYIYRYLKRLIDYQTVNAANYEDWVNDYTGDYHGDKIVHDSWTEEQQDQVFNRSARTRTMGKTSLPASGDAPRRPVLPYLPRNTISVGTSFSSVYYSEFKMQITWQSTAEEFFTGVGKPGAKKGELWFAINGTDVIDLEGYGSGYLDRLNFDEVSLYWQRSDNSYSRLNLKGMNHKNTVYGGKSINISMKEALSDEEESGFIIPIHYGTLNDMSAVKQAQLAMTSGYLLFNSYQLVKKKWYQTGIFKVLLVIVVVIVVAVTGGFGAAGVGILGTNAAVGAAVGLTGLAAVIAGVVINAVAAMIVTKMLTAASVALLGEKVGHIIGAVLSVVAISTGAGMMGGGQSMTEAFKTLLDPSKLMAMSVAVTNGVSATMQAEAQDYMKKAGDLMDAYETDSSNILDKSRELFGSSDFSFDPLQLTDIGLVQGEAPADFFARTLMTGMDVAEITLDSLNLFPSVTISTPLP